MHDSNFSAVEIRPHAALARCAESWLSWVSGVWGICGIGGIFVTTDPLVNKSIASVLRRALNGVKEKEGQIYLIKHLLKVTLFSYTTILSHYYKYAGLVSISWLGTKGFALLLSFCFSSILTLTHYNWSL